jgi:imidazoleglycerol-phosphate dehydratase/histidinol-phosphatase
MRPILFIDRDGTIIDEPDDEKIEKIEKLTFLTDVLFYLRKIQSETNFLLVMVTNQDGLGTDIFPDEEFWPVHNFVMRTLEGERIQFDAIHIDEHLESDRHPNRKPGIGMLQDYISRGYDIANSFVIGDRTSDIELAKNLGCKSIHISESAAGADLTTNNWKEIYEFLID